mmetsp:Transcript_68815/g.163947  ORF Transcript_68815/g.163947 Transcript_68815/m.163947 type:complete len:84 (+) Transcript_68815:1586-1837(+)
MDGHLVGRRACLSTGMFSIPACHAAACHAATQFQQPCPGSVSHQIFPDKLPEFITRWRRGFCRLPVGGFSFGLKIWCQPYGEA